MATKVAFGDTGAMIYGPMNKLFQGHSFVILFALFALAGSCIARGDILLADAGRAQVIIVLSDEASLPEKTAAEELQCYLQKITSASFKIVEEKDADTPLSGIWVGPTRKAQSMNLYPSTPETWAVKTSGRDLILCGRRPRGTLYAVYHFLEDVLGVRWWNSQEEFVPHRRNLSLEEINLQGTPAFQRRCINMVYAGFEPPCDNGAFMVRSRMNSRGTAGPPIDPKYGCDDGLLVDSRPWGSHTFNLYVTDRETLIKIHPEYFALTGGSRTVKTLDLTNPGLRDFIADKLKNWIETDRDHALKSGHPKPRVYNLSKEDEPNLFSESPQSTAIKKREGSEAGVLLDFVNDQAKRVHAYDPDVFIETLAYQNTEDPPKTLKAADNVIITLCDTESIVTLPVTHPRNKEFADKVDQWSRRTRNLRIWDYGYCYMPEGWEYPTPTEFTYQPDYRFFLQKDVQGIFTQFESPSGVILGDMPDLKRWLIAKLMENPSLDTGQLIETFTQGYYGLAGKYIREYRTLLNEAAKKKPPGYMVLCSCEHTTLHYLDIEFLVKAKKLFEKAEEVCGNDLVFLRRVHHARASLDAAELMRYPMLKRYWQLQGKNPKKFPLDGPAAADRLKRTLFEQSQQRTPKGKDDPGVSQLARKIDLYCQLRSDWPLPRPFSRCKAGQLYEFVPPCIPRIVSPAEVVVDPEAECNLAIRIPWTGKISPETKLFKAGVIQMEAMPTQIVVSEGNDFKKEDTKGAGYRWYKVLSDVTVRHDSRCYFALPAVWNVQFSCDMPSFDATKKYNFWARLKFQGPSFSGDTDATKDYIYLERVIMVSHDKSPAKDLGI